MEKVEVVEEGDDLLVVIVRGGEREKGTVGFLIF